ncbi:MAG: DUF2200 domain-containing protein [Pseudomonadota bacterium]
MKQPPAGTGERMAKMTLAQIYPMYVNKVEKKGRSEAELLEVIEWLTGHGEKAIRKMIDAETTFGELFEQSTLNPNAHLITGVICGYRVEELEDPFIQQVRYLDKLIDELARGKKMEKIMRSAE